MSKTRSKTTKKNSAVKTAPIVKKAGSLKPVFIISAIITGLLILTGIALTVGKNISSAKKTAALAASLTPVAQATTQPENTPVAAPAATPVITPFPELADISKGVESKAVIKQINLEEAKYLYDTKKAIFVDARSREEYTALHIKNAISIPVNTAAADITANRAALSQAGKVIVVYCHGIGCHLSDKTAYEIYDAGYKNVAVFFGGWNSWSDAKYPESK